MSPATQVLIFWTQSSSNMKPCHRGPGMVPVRDQLAPRDPLRHPQDGQLAEGGVRRLGAHRHLGERRV